MSQSLAELYRYRELLWMWTLREIKVRYKQSVLGGLWAVLQPLSLMLIFTAIFGYIVKVPTDGIPYPIFSFATLVPWTLFTTSVTFAVPSLLNNMNLVTKVYCPREIFPISSLGAALFDYIIALVLLLVLIPVYGWSLHATFLLLPLLLAVQIMLTLGMALLGSALTVLYRDVRFVVPLGLQLWMYATPIVYPLSLVPERFRAIYMLNPMASLMDGYRRITLLGQSPDWGYLGISAVVSLLVLVVGYAYFKHAEATFADII